MTRIVNIFTLTIASWALAVGIIVAVWNILDDRSVDIADRITFADLGVVRRHGNQWNVENASDEAVAFAMSHNQRAA